MKKDVLVGVSGFHYAVDEGENQEPVEIISPATYHEKNGKHYIIYDEPVEGMTGTIHNVMKLTGDKMFEITKSGLTNSRLVFEKDKIHMTNYQTPFGEMLVGVHTREIDVLVEEEKIQIDIYYRLDVNNEPLSDCHIKVNVRSVS